MVSGEELIQATCGQAPCGGSPTKVGCVPGGSCPGEGPAPAPAWGIVGGAERGTVEAGRGNSGARTSMVCREGVADSCPARWAGFVPTPRMLITKTTSQYFNFASSKVSMLLPSYG